MKVTPIGADVIQEPESATAELNPLSEITVIVADSLIPWTIEIEDAEDLIKKSGRAAEVTVTVMLAECESEPLVPITVIV